MRCNFLILCNFASRLDTGSPILAGIFRHVVVPGFPAPLGTVQVACEVEVDPPQAGRSYFLDLTFSDEDGKVLYETQVELGFEKRPDSGPSYCYFAGPVTVQTPLQRPGLYRFDLLFNGDSIAQARLDVSSS